VVEESCFFLREHDDAPSPVGKAFEQFDRPSPLPSPAINNWKRVYRQRWGTLHRRS
jgi:hypothetical protein